MEQQQVTGIEPESFNMGFTYWTDSKLQLFSEIFRNIILSMTLSEMAI